MMFFPSFFHVIKNVTKTEKKNWHPIFLILRNIFKIQMYEVIN